MFKRIALILMVLGTIELMGSRVTYAQEPQTIAVEDTAVTFIRASKAPKWIVQQACLGYTHKETTYVGNGYVLIVMIRPKVIKL